MNKKKSKKSEKRKSKKTHQPKTNTTPVAGSAPPNDQPSKNVHSGTNSITPSEPSPSSIRIDLGSLDIITHYKKRRTSLGGHGFKIYITVKDKKSKSVIKSLVNEISGTIYGPLEENLAQMDHYKVPAKLLPSGRYFIHFTPVKTGKYFGIVKFQNHEIQPRETTLYCVKRHLFKIWFSDTGSEPSSSESEGEPDLALSAVNFSELKLS